MSMKYVKRSLVELHGRKTRALSNALIQNAVASAVPVGSTPVEYVPHPALKAMCDELENDVDILARMIEHFDE